MLKKHIYDAPKTSTLRLKTSWHGMIINATFARNQSNINMLIDKIEELLKEVSQLSANNADEVEQLRLRYLSKKGEINALMSEFRNVAADQKKTIGIKINELKQQAQEKINALRDSLQSTKTQDVDTDLTRTPYPIKLGTRHPLTLVQDEIIDIFARMGFILFQGPEIDDDEHVFTMLNFPADHPARDMQDTFFIERDSNITQNVLLRSHTTNDEAHYMSTNEPPIRVLCPGRVYRNEAISARAHCFFHQVEGLYIDKGVSFADLKQVLLTFAREMFGTNTKIRLRPSYFPFTEPSAELDISCNICGGKGCGFCKHTGWVEILGCGMTDPHDLAVCGIDPDIYTGYAFGMGVERIANLKYRVNDLRLFSENDVRFLREFESAT
ncbi:phenylalanyl-tRNA synthetase subunit alpha [Prevotella micans F0438]|uniref:Phenylalanine--tRNA ligase alpha subunit n=2 Tax=Prevotella micans TaxID=189723 RepID=H1Q4G7_9BACT|nr:phenylalanyl-tRNA synthetase subunit alpha [Prevotella micans F0438]